jgi:hypothetical protein
MNTYLTVMTCGPDRACTFHIQEVWLHISAQTVAIINDALMVFLCLAILLLGQKAYPKLDNVQPPLPTPLSFRAL